MTTRTQDVVFPLDDETLDKLRDACFGVIEIDPDNEKWNVVGNDSGITLSDYLWSEDTKSNLRWTPNGVIVSLIDEVRRLRQTSSDSADPE